MNDTRKPRWHQHENSDFEAKWADPLDEPLGDTVRQGRTVVLGHSSGRQHYVKVYCEMAENGPYLDCWLDEGRETFIHPDALSSLTKLLSLSTQSLIRWEGET